MASRRSGNRVKPYSLTVKTYSASGKLSKKSIRISSNTSTSSLQQGSSVRGGDSNNSVSEEFEASDVFDDDRESADEEQAIRSQYERRRIKEGECWKSLQDKLVKTYIENSAMSLDQCCVKCVEDGRSERATARCIDCGPNQFFCLQCAECLHLTRNLFHVVEVWKNDCEMFVPLLLGSTYVLSDPQHVNCPTAETRIITCVDERGRQHLKQVEFCKCVSDAATLVKLQLWPGTPTKPKVAFHFNLMDLAEKFLLESHVSLHKFCSSVETEYPFMLPKLIKNIYAILNSGSFDEYRYFKHRLRSLDLISSDLIDYTKCQLCPQHDESGVSIHSLDACFGLTRKKTAGKSYTTPNHGCLKFADQDEVDNFVDNYSKSKKIEGESCQTFKAGEVTEALRSKGKNNLFDEKGVFGSCCSRHTHPGRFLSIKYGERISYSIFELEHLLERARRNSNVDVKVMYDIGCILSSHLQANGRHDIVSNVSIAVPIFHCYGHKASCQVEFSPRRLEGFGLTDGEAIERLWSYLRGFSSITKEMSASRRIDLLTDALLHLSRRNFRSSGKLLLTKLKKCKDLQVKTQAELVELFSQLPVEYSSETVDIWETREKETILNKTRESRQNKETWKEKYVRKLLHYKQLRSVAACGSYEEIEEVTTEDPSVHQVSKKLYNLHKTLKTIESQHSLKQRWKPGDLEFDAVALQVNNERQKATLSALHALSIERHFLLTLKKKYADGQQIAIRLSRQITKVTNNMKLTIEKCNASTDSLRDFINGLPERIIFDQVNDPTSELFSDLTSTEICNPGEASTQIPIYIKRKAVDLHLFLRRIKEEEQLLVVERERLLSYYTNMCCKIDREIACIGDLTGSRHRFSLGSKHELLRLRVRLQNELFDVKKVFGVPLGETVLIQAEMWNLSMDDVENFIDSDGITVDTDEQSEDDEDVEELSDIESDLE